MLEARWPAWVGWRRIRRGTSWAAWPAWAGVPAVLRLRLPAPRSRNGCADRDGRVQGRLARRGCPPGKGWTGARGPDLAASARRLQAAQRAGIPARLTLHHLQALDAGARREMRGGRWCWGVVPGMAVPRRLSLWLALAPGRLFGYAAAVGRGWSVPFCCGAAGPPLPRFLPLSSPALSAIWPARYLPPSDLGF